MNAENLERFIQDYRIDKTRGDTLSVRGKSCRNAFKFDGVESELINLKYFPDIVASEINHKVFTQCMNHINAQKSEVPSDMNQSGELLGFKGNVFDLKIVAACNKPRSNGIVAIDYKKLKILPNIVNKDVLVVIREMLDDDLWKQWRFNNYSMRVTEYKPKMDKLFYEDKDNLYLNTYVKPEYLKTYDSSTNYPEPTDFIKLLKQVFFKDHQREVMEEFFYYCVSNIRAKQAIVAVGRQGCGKGTTFNKTLGALVGRTNHYSLANSFAASQFESGVRGHTVVFADELDFKSKKAKNKYKNLIGNDVVTIEEKHVSAHQSEEIQANFIFASNYLKDFFAEIADRLFLYPEMSDVKLEDALGSKWVDNYVKKLEDPEFLLSIYHYLFKKFGHIKESRIIKMESQNELLALHRNDLLYRQAFLKLCYTGDPVVNVGEDAPYFMLKNVREEMRDIKGNSEKGLPQVRLDEILAYIEEYKNRFGKELAVYEEDGRNRRFKSLVHGDETIGSLIR